MIRKCLDSGSDQHLALLDIRNTPTQGVGSSPVQRLMNRRTKTLIPTKSGLLDGGTKNQDKENLQKRQDKQRRSYDKTAKDLPGLREGDVVRMKPTTQGQKTWRKAVVSRQLDNRSYEVTTGDDVSYRRNRVHLRRSLEPPPTRTVEADMDPGAHHDIMDDPPDPGPAPEQLQRNDPRPAPNQEPVVVKPIPQIPAPRRSSRATREPGHLKDFVK